MGRSFESVRMGVREVSARWARAGRALKKEDQSYAEELAKMAKIHFPARHSMHWTIHWRRPYSPC